MESLATVFSACLLIYIINTIVSADLISDIITAENFAFVKERGTPPIVCPGVVGK